MKLEQERIQANLQKYHGDQQQTEPDSTATDDNVASESASAPASHDISEEIRKAKEVAQSLAGKEVSDLFHFVIIKENEIPVLILFTGLFTGTDKQFCG